MYRTYAWDNSGGHDEPVEVGRGEVWAWMCRHFGGADKEVMASAHLELLDHQGEITLMGRTFEVVEDGGE